MKTSLLPAFVLAEITDAVNFSDIEPTDPIYGLLEYLVSTPDFVGVLHEIFCSLEKNPPSGFLALATNISRGRGEPLGGLASMVLGWGREHYAKMMLIY